MFLSFYFTQASLWDFITFVFILTIKKIHFLKTVHFGLSYTDSK